MKKLTRLQLILLMVAVICAFSVTGLALAQASTYFDLGCWGALSGGGGQRLSSTATLNDAFGQMASGVSNSATVVIRGGHLQNWALLQPTPAPTTTPPSPTGPENTFMPLIGSFVRTVRACQ